MDKVGPPKPKLEPEVNVNASFRQTWVSQQPEKFGLPPETEALGFPRSPRGEQIFSAACEHTKRAAPGTLRDNPKSLACPQRLKRWASPEAPGANKSFSAACEHTKRAAPGTLRDNPKSLACPQRLKRWASPEAPGANKSFRQHASTQSAQHRERFVTTRKVWLAPRD